MICLICRQAELVEGFTSVVLERGETRLVINKVPVRVCPNCGDAVVEEEIGVNLLRAGDEMSLVGMREQFVNYGEILLTDK